MKLFEVVQDLKAGWGFCKPYRVAGLGQALGELVQKANLNPEVEVEVSYHHFNTGDGPGFRYNYFWEIRNFPEITLSYDEYRPLWGRHDFSYDPEARVVSFGYSR